MSTSSTGGQTVSTSSFLPASISSDGRFVVFESNASTLVSNDSNESVDVFVKDLLSNQTTRVSVSSSGVQGNADSAGFGGGVSRPAMSRDGRFVAFTSKATNLVAGDTNKVSDVFIHDRTTLTTVRASTGAGAVELNGSSEIGGLSADGRYLSFFSYATNAVAGFANTVHVYRKDMVTGALVAVTQNSSGAVANRESFRSDISADGSQVTFESLATNLDAVSADVNGGYDVFVRNIPGGKTVRVSVATDSFQQFGQVGPFGAYLPSISGNGRFVTFTVDSGLILASNDTNGLYDVYVRDRDVDADGIFDEVVDGFESSTVRTFLVSTGTAGEPGNHHSFAPSISFDGRFVAFESYADNLVAADTNFTRDVFLRDLDSDGNGVFDEPGKTTTLRVSESTDGVLGNDESAGSRMSADGRSITYFSNASNLVPGDTNGTSDFFVHDRFFIVSSAEAAALQPRLSGDARFLAFSSSTAGFVPNDTNAASDVFIRDRAKGTVVRVSVATSGQQANGASFTPSINGNGRFVAFESDASNLVADDTNGVRDVFLRDRDTDGNGAYDEAGGVATILVSRSIGGAVGRGASANAVISTNGRFVAFSSLAANLVLSDTNGLRDIFRWDRLQAATMNAIVRVNVGAAGQATGGDSDAPAISSAGDFIAFESAASNLVQSGGTLSDTADTNGVRDVFRWPAVAGQSQTLVRVSRTVTQAQAQAASIAPSISGDGQTIAFASLAQLDLDDGNDTFDVYSFTVPGLLVKRENLGPGHRIPNGATTQPVLSADGRFISFTSQATNLSPLDADIVDDVYIRNRATNDIRLVSVDVATASSNSSVSHDGRTVAFATVAGISGSGLFGLRSNVDTGESQERTVVQNDPAAPVDAPAVTPSQGPAHASVRVLIRASNMVGIRSVQFGGGQRWTEATSLEPIDGTSMWVVSPALPAGAVDIKLVGESDQTQTLSNKFRYTGESQGPLEPTDCTVTPTTTASRVAKGGGDVTVNVQTQPGCAWSAVSEAEWLHVTLPPGTAATGAGSFTVQIAPNEHPADRDTRVFVSNTFLSLAQDGQGCGAATVEPANRRVEMAAGDTRKEDLVSITIGDGCDWSATSSAPWLRVQGARGSGGVTLNADANTVPMDRTATVTVQGVAIQVTQLGIPAPTSCSYTLAVLPSVVGAQADATGSLNITTAGTCPWNASVVDQGDARGWLELTGPASGTGSGSVTFRTKSANIGTDRAASFDVEGRTAPITQTGSRTGLPFGSVDSPRCDASLTDPQTPGAPCPTAVYMNLSGSIGLTGWSLDNDAVTAVDIFRIPVAGEPQTNVGEPGLLWIGSATFARGARPDVRNQFASMPNSDRAGWGYLMLTSQLPNGGNGTFTFVFRAHDGPGRYVHDAGGLRFDGGSAGNVVELGRRTLHFNNAAATVPFGAIDFPGSGDTISGTSFNQAGWVLTPNPKLIPTSGSTIRVILDGVDVGSVDQYGFPRPDVKALFPGLQNADGPAARLILNTALLTDGLHQVAWVVTDNAGAAAGVGSRYFTVANGVGASLSASAPSHASLLPVAGTDVRSTLVISGERELLQPDQRGVRHVVIPAGEVVRLRFDGAATYQGFLMGAAGPEPLPVGSTLNADDGEFAWQPGTGFAGVYELLFVRRAGSAMDRLPVRVVVVPGTASGDALLSVRRDGRTVTGSVVHGDAVQLRHVVAFAYPKGGGPPVAIAEQPVTTPPPGGTGLNRDFATRGFNIALDALPFGTYDIAIEARSELSTALTTRVWLRGVQVR